MEIAEFLLARIAEDEAVARAAISAEPLYCEGEWIHQWVDDPWVGSSEEPWRFITRFDPARVVADCEAKRRIVDRHPPGEHDCAGVHHREAWNSPCDDLRDLAAVYADHADYDGTWRPGRVWEDGDPAPDTTRSYLGALDPLIGKPRW